MVNVFVCYLHSEFLAEFISPFLYCAEEQDFATTQLKDCFGGWGEQCKIHQSSLQMPKSNLRAQYCWRCATWVYFRAAGHPTPEENICTNISKTSVCILLKSAYDGGQELWEKWTDFSKAWDAVNHSSPLLSHPLWYFSHMPDKWTAQFWGGKMLDVNGKAREKNANVREKKWLAGRRNWRRLLVWLRFYKSWLRKQPHN